MVVQPTHRQLLFEKLPRTLPLRKSPPDIPEDVYSCIFDYIIKPRQTDCGRGLCPLHMPQGDPVEYRELLSKLTLVCRLFAIVFTPVLLDTMPIAIVPPSLSFKTWILDRYQSQSLGRFARALAQDNQLACARILYVKECRLISSQEKWSRFCSLEAKFLAAVTERLPRTMRSLYFKNVCVTDKFFTDLGTLTNLSSLTLSRLIFPSQLVFPQHVQHRLESFSLFDITLTAPLSRLATMQSLCDFICHGSTPRLQVLCTDDDTLLEVFVNQPCIPHLKVLEIDLPNLHSVHALLSHLAQLPFLNTLSIRALFYYTRTTPLRTSNPLLQFSMLNLQHLHCPAFMAPSLIPNRPLKTIDLIYVQERLYNTHLIDVPPTDGITLFHFLQQSTSSIEVLRVPSYVYVAAAHLFDVAFPHLAELALRFPVADREMAVTTGKFIKYISAICNARQISTLPITRLSLVFDAFLSKCQWACNLALQARTIALLHSRFSALQCIKLCTTYDRGWIWHRQWDRQNGNSLAWKPSLGREDQKTIQEALKETPTWYPDPEKDIDGTFTSLFSPPMAKPWPWRTSSGSSEPRASS